MEPNIMKLRFELDEMGYFQQFTPESAILVNRLFSDLKTTTTSLQKYMTIAQNAIEERDNLQVGAEPYKCDNARLVKECNLLHLALIEKGEKFENIKQDLKGRLEEQSNDLLELKAEKATLKSRLRNLESKLIQKGSIRAKPSRVSLQLHRSPQKSQSFEIDDTMALADEKIANLSREIKKLKSQNVQLVEATDILQNQLNTRDKEINRLNGLFEGGRPLNAIRRDCCCNKENHSNSDDINKLKHEKSTLEMRLKEAIDKQHEAMKRALHLAERNKLLEKEMKDIDHLALAVETECNNTVKCNTEKVNRLKNRMHSSVLQIQTLERENAKLKQEKTELSADLDAVILEKKHLQTVLETSLDEKKRLSDRINNFTIIEQDLNKEIDRLSRLSAEQKRRIAELDCSLVSEKVQDKDYSPQSSPRKKGKKKKLNKTNKSNKSVKSSKSTKAAPKATKQKSQVLNESKPSESSCDCNCSLAKQLKELLEKELEFKQEQTARCMETLRNEKEYYMKEYHKLLEELKQPLATRRTSASSVEKEELVQKLFDLEQNLTSLRQENKFLLQEKQNMKSRLNTARDRSETDFDGPCLKTVCKRNERECALLRADVERLEEEISTGRLKLKNSYENQSYDTDRYKKALFDAEEQIKKLEIEKRKSQHNQGLIGTLEEQSSTLKEQLRNAQSELNHQKMLYQQLKTLHEQTDRSLSDTQAKLRSSENDLGRVLDDLKKKDLDTGVASKEVTLLRNDVQIIKNQLTQIDKEKDELLVALDDKTEKLATLEAEIRLKDKTISTLESTIADLRKKISATIDESASQEHQFRSTQSELLSLRQDLESTRRIRDGALDENRRLQNDLAAVTCDNRDTRNELELCKRQIDDLKTQLQHYVAEIKRTEDLISNKEVERNEILDQFRSLSQEANMLESNNHHLETEASQTKVQLSVALDHTADLERHLENKDSIIRSYEKQISELTSQVASLEMQLRHCMQQYESNEAELAKMRDFCLKLETEGTSFKRQLRERDDQRSLADRNVEQLRSERELLQTNLSKDKRNVESMEKFLDDARKESGELQLLNQDLQEEVQRLKIQLQDIKDRFLVTSEQLDMYQEKALEYSQQNKQLRREVANERFRRSRDSESTTKSLCPCPFKYGNNKRATDSERSFNSGPSTSKTNRVIFSKSNTVEGLLIGPTNEKEECVCWTLDDKYHDKCIMNKRGGKISVSDDGVFIMSPSREKSNDALNG